jgi:hypothetical protein
LIDRQTISVSGSVGVEFEQVRFEDNQTTPNHTNVEYGPMLVVGLSLSF